MNTALLIVVALLVAVIGGAIALAIVTSRIAARTRVRRAAHFVALAERLGATVLPGDYPAMRGMTQGRGFHLGPVPAGKSRFSLARAGMLVGSSIRLELHPQTSALVASMLADIETGDRTFDDAMIVRSDRREAALAILDSGIRAGLLDLAARQKGFRLVVHGQEATLEWQGDFASAEMAERAGTWVGLLARIAEGCEREAAE